MKAVTISVNQNTLHYLEEGGVSTEVVSVTGAEELVDWVRDGLYEVLIVDLDESGLGTFFPRAIRKQKFPIPIVGIGAGAEGVSWSEYRANFLEQGGDDLIKAPGNPREILASLRAVSRRFHGGMMDILTFSLEGVTLKINLARKQVMINDHSLHLTFHESKLFLTLAEHVGRIVSKETILSALYTNEFDEAEIKIVDVFICKVRKKLSEEHPSAGNFIQTIWGRGYMLSETFQSSRSRVA